MRQHLLLFTLIILGAIFSYSQDYWTVTQLGVSGTNYDIGRDNSGNVHIIWLSGSELYYGRIVNGVITGRELIPRGGTSVHVRFTRPRLAVRPDGATIHTSWIDFYNGGGRALLHAWRDSSGIWHNETAWSNNGGSYYIAYPSAGADLSGVVHIIAQRWSNWGSWYTIYGRKYGGSWTWYTLTSGKWRQHVGFTDKNGGFHATWRSLGSPGEYRYCPNGGNLAGSATQYIPIVPGTDTPSMGDLFVTDNGDVHNAFISFGIGQIDYYVKRAGSSSFGELGHPSNGPYRVCDDENDPWPAIIADNSGQVVVAFAEQTNCAIDGFNKLSVAFSQGGTWQRFTIDENAHILSSSKPAMTFVNSIGYLVWRSITGQLLLARSMPPVTPALQVISPNGDESWEGGTNHLIKWSSEGIVNNIKIEYTSDNGESWNTITSSTANDGTYTWRVPSINSSECKVRVKEASDGSPSDTSNDVFSITTSGSGTGEISLNRENLFFASISSGSQTSAQEIWVSNTGTGAMNWTVINDSSWLNTTPASGTNNGVITVSANTSGLQSGAYIGTISVSSSDAINSPQKVTVTLTVKSSSTDQIPFGEFSTPENNSTVQSSIPVTGWVLDDVEVQSVKIYNGSDHIGNAVFVEGARPDVEQAYSTYPKNYKAGWGYMLLTYYLPNGGNGRYTLFAKATDSSGQEVTLGSKTITVDNANAVKPFGAIDSPDQGGSASGDHYINWGWALTPQPNSIPTDGSTIDVYIDNTKLGNPTYNKYRSDVATLFPGYANTEGAVGFLNIDTTEFENGIHTIMWVVSDSAGNTDGIGSRYFTIMNSNSSRSSLAQLDPSYINNHHLLKTTHKFRDQSSVWVKKGYQKKSAIEMAPNDAGEILIEIKELERVVIHLTKPSVDSHEPDNESLTPNNQNNWCGFQIMGDQYKKLPIGSNLDRKKGIFGWQPGPGFIYDYPLVFFNIKSNGQIQQINTTIKINPKNSPSQK